MEAGPPMPGGGRPPQRERRTRDRPADGVGAAVDRLLGPLGRVHAAVPALVLFVLSLVLTLIAWRLSDEQQERRLQERFEFQASEIVTAITRRLRAYEHVLRSGTGLFDVVGTVGRAEWRRFAEAQRLDIYYPGIQGFGVSLLIQPKHLAAHEAQVRAEGFPDYRVRPPGPREVYSSIVYLEPFGGRNLRAFGYDMFSEPVRREAMERARDTGAPAFSGIVTLVQETETDVQRGFLAYVPVYEAGRPLPGAAERRAALRGWVYAPFRANDLMRGILGGSEGGIDIHIYDGPAADPAALLYDSSSAAGRDADGRAGDGRRHTRSIEVGGRQWTLVFVELPGFEAAERTPLPTVVGVLGLLVDTLLFSGTFAILRLRQREREWRRALLDEHVAVESRFRLAMAATRSGVWEFHPGSSRWTLGSELAQLLGYEARVIGDLSHGAWMNNVLGRDLPQVVAWIKRVSARNMAEAEADTVRFRCRHLGGGVLVLEAHGAVQQRPDGEIILRGIMRDVTQTATAEAAMRKVEEEIAAARTRQRFLAVVSHEVRTPINGVLGLARLLLDSELSNEQRDFAEMIVRSGESMLALVNDILDLSKMEAGKFTLEPGPCDLRALVDDVVAVMGARAAEKRLAVVARVAPEVPASVSVDEARLRQILLNLVGNAVKFTDQGGLTVDVEAEPADDDALTLAFHIADTGPGISEEERAKLFQEYSQVESRSTKKSGGTGLGLAISRKLAVAMGGGAEVTSRLGEGSVFVVTVRVTALDPPPRTTRVAGLRIIVAEPVPLVSACLARALADRGFVAAETGGAPDVAVVSWRVPSVDAQKVTAAAGRTVWLTPVDCETARPNALIEPLRQSDLDAIAAWCDGRAARLEPATRGGRISDPLGRRADPGGRPLSILIVEDNTVNRRVLTATLERHGHKCLAVENGSLAAFELAAGRFDIVVMDRHMPVMDGLEATRRIRETDGAMRHVPIVGLTASVAEEDLVACRAAGMNEVLTKPVQPEKLLATLRHLTDGAPRSGTDTSATADGVREAPAAPAAGSFDRSAIDNLTDLLGADGVAEILGDFRTSAERLAAELVPAVERDDRPTIARVAHTVKSSAGTIGFVELSRMAEKVEEGARERAEYDVGLVRRFAGLLDQAIGAAIALTANTAVGGSIKPG